MKRIRREKHKGYANKGCFMEEAKNEMEDSMKNLYDKLDKNVCNVKFIVDKKEGEVDDTINVRYTRQVDDTDIMIIDTGCPKTLSERNLVEQYCEKNNIIMKELETKKCKQKFRFGPSQVYVSEEIVTLPITLEGNDNQVSFVRLYINNYRVEAKHVPLLCG